MTRPDLDAIEAREAAATPGPWIADVDFVVDANGRPVFDASECALVGDEYTATLAFIAEARTAVPALVAYARELEADAAEHTREVMLHAVTKHKLAEAERERDALSSQCGRLWEMLDVLVYWHDKAGRIDESWWDAAREALARGEAKP